MSAYSDRVIADGATNYWRLNETSGTSAVDVVGAKHGTITPTGVTLNQTGALTDGDKAMLFDGLSGKIGLPAVRSVQPAFTYEAWVKMTNGGGEATIFSRNWTDAAGCRLGRIGDIPKFEFAAGGLLTSPVAFVLGAWTHVAVTGNGTTGALYLNGQVVVTGALVSPADAGTGASAIGELPPYQQYWIGFIDDVAVYPRALTAPEILSHYTLGTTVVASGGRPLSLGYWKKVWSAA